MLLFVIFILLHLHSSNSHLNHRYLYPYSGTPRIKSHTFVLTEGLVQPDNYVQKGYLINGQFPGPTIFVNQFDTLEIIVHNRMTVPITIHCHGLLQYHTVASDGVPHVTQYPIQPNQSYTYQIDIMEQTGTYMYHGHVAYSIVWITGVIIILDNPFFYHDLGKPYFYDYGHEFSFLMGDIYHYDLQQYLKDVTGPWKGTPPVEAIHINGLSYGWWPENNGNAEGYQVVPVTPGKRYRFRVINLGVETFLRFQIEGHSFTVIEMDGIICHPVTTDRLELHIGQRYSILVDMNQPIANYWITSAVIGKKGGPANGRAILSYDGAPNPDNMRRLVFKDPTPPLNWTDWIIPELRTNKIIANSPSEYYPVPEKADRGIFIDTVITKEGYGGEQRILINGHWYQEPEVPYFIQAQMGVDIEKDNPQVYGIRKGEAVDIIFQNRALEPEGICLEHPWHVHGHTYYVVAEGADLAPPKEELEWIIANNIEKGYLQYRDVVVLYPRQTVQNKTSGAPCGWVVIRFLADNPGIWIAHCHIATHQITGKRFVISERAKNNPALWNE